MGKGEAAGASGLGSCGGEADKAELPFPSIKMGNVLTGQPGQLLEEQGSCSVAQNVTGVTPCGCSSPWLRAQQISVQKDSHRIDPASGYR